VLGSIVAQTPLLQGFLHLQRGWGCLRLLGTRLEQLTPEQSAELLAEAQRAIDGLRALARAEWQAFADALEANLKLLGRAPAEADILLERACETFRSTQYLACAACARRRRGELMSGELATRWVAEADAELEKLGVRNPARFARAYFSLF
jgi:hypothetical protein